MVSDILEVLETLSECPWFALHVSLSFHASVKLPGARSHSACFGQREAGGRTDQVRSHQRNTVGPLSALLQSIQVLVEASQLRCSLHVPTIG